MTFKKKDDQGVLKIAMIVTDSESSNNIEAITQAKLIKDRGINVVTIGIGDLKLQELIDMASSPSDVYKVDDFDKDQWILSSISFTAYQQLVAIVPEKQITSLCDKMTYKFFMVPLLQNKRYFENFTIELEDIEGRSDIYYILFIF